MKTLEPKTVSKNGIKVTDKGDYFRVVFDGVEVSTFGKSPNAFATAEELLNWLLRR